jgi:LysR family cyn operon transcriptional activator
MSESIEIRHLRYFLAVAETENFTRAARRLRISQPSVSQQVAQLERELRTPLFQRMGNRVRLTEAGAAFRLGAEVVLRKLEDACRSVQNVTGLITGHVDIGVIPALHVAWVPPMLERMSCEYPGVTVGVREQASSGIETELEAGRLDVGLGLVTRGSPSIRYERLLSEPFSVLVAEGHKFARRRSIAIAELERERLVLLPESFDMRRAAEELFRRARVRPRVAFEIDSVGAALGCVLRAGTPTLLPAIVLRGREVLRLRAIPLAGKVPRIDFGLLWPSSGAASPAASVLAGALKAIVAGGARSAHGPARALSKPGDRAGSWRSH